MKRIKFLQAVIVLVGLLLSACAPAAAPSADSANVGGSKAVTAVTFTGVIERMDGDQWIVDSQKITVDASVVRDGAFVVGDTVKVEALIAGDGSLVAQRVEMPSASDLAGANANESNGNSNDNAVDNGNVNDTNVNANDDNSNDANSNDDNSNAANGNDDNSNDDNGDDNSNNNDDDSNDDNGNDDNSNEDHGGNGNGSDDNDDDDDSGGSGGDDND
jgi:hypothetical protein